MTVNIFPPIHCNSSAWQIASKTVHNSYWEKSPFSFIFPPNIFFFTTLSFPQPAGSCTWVGITICPTGPHIHATEEWQSQMVHHCQGMNGTAPTQTVSLRTGGTQQQRISLLISSNCCWPISAIPSPVYNKSSTFYMKNEVITRWIQWLIAHRSLWEMWDKSMSDFERLRKSKLS